MAILAPGKGKSELADLRNLVANFSPENVPKIKEILFGPNINQTESNLETICSLFAEEYKKNTDSKYRTAVRSFLLDTANFRKSPAAAILRGYTTKDLPFEIILDAYLNDELPNFGIAISEFQTAAKKNQSDNLALMKSKLSDKTLTVKGRGKLEYYISELGQVKQKEPHGGARNFQANDTSLGIMPIDILLNRVGDKARKNKEIADLASEIKQNGIAPLLTFLGRYNKELASHDKTKFKEIIRLIHKHFSQAIKDSSVDICEQALDFAKTLKLQDHIVDALFDLVKIKGLADNYPKLEAFLLSEDNENRPMVFSKIAGAAPDLGEKLIKRMISDSNPRLIKFIFDRISNSIRSNGVGYLSLRLIAEIDFRATKLQVTTPFKMWTARLIAGFKTSGDYRRERKELLKEYASDEERLTALNRLIGRHVPKD